MVRYAIGTKTRPPYAIGSVDNALRLAAILQMEGRITVTEAASRLGVAPSSAHRLLTMLVYRDFARRDGTAYVVGPLLRPHGTAGPRLARLRQLARLPMSDLVEERGDTCSLLTLDGGCVRFLTDVKGPNDKREGSREGMIFPAHRTTGGLIMLAVHPDERIEEFYTDPRAADLLPTGEELDIEAILRRVGETRQRGYAVNVGLSERDVVGFGVPVPMPPGEPSAAVALAMSFEAYNKVDERAVIDTLRHTARRIGDAVARDLSHSG